jgi:hypothetical protein
MSLISSINCESSTYLYRWLLSHDKALIFNPWASIYQLRYNYKAISMTSESYPLQLVAIESS